MDAKPTLARTLPPEKHVELPGAVALGILASAAVLTCIALAVFSRRLAGAFERPAPAAPLIATAVVVGMHSWLSRRLWRAAKRHSRCGSVPLTAEGAVAWAPSAAVVLYTFGLSWPLSRGVDWLVWMPLWMAEVVWLKAFYSPPFKEVSAASRRVALRGKQQASAAVVGETHAPEAEMEVVQQLTRLRDQHGQESMVGSLRANFGPGQRTTEVYVGFCPPFQGTPTIEVEQTEGPHARLTVGQVLPHGARVDVRLDKPGPAADRVVLDLYACG